MRKQILSCIAGGLFSFGMANGVSAATVQLEYQGSSAFGSLAWYRNVGINLNGRDM